MSERLASHPLFCCRLSERYRDASITMKISKEPTVLSSSTLDILEVSESLYVVRLLVDIAPIPTKGSQLTKC